MKLTNKQYDILKFVAWFWGPLFIFLSSVLNYFTVKWDPANDILFVLGAVDVFIGALVSKSNIDYNKEEE